MSECSQVNLASSGEQRQFSAVPKPLPSQKISPKKANRITKSKQTITTKTNSQAPAAPVTPLPGGVTIAPTPPSTPSPQIPSSGGAEDQGLFHINLAENLNLENVFANVIVSPEREPEGGSTEEQEQEQHEQEHEQGQLQLLHHEEVIQTLPSPSPTFQLQHHDYKFNLDSSSASYHHQDLLLTSIDTSGSGPRPDTRVNIIKPTWEEAVAATILPVRCKDTNAELYKAKFGSGNKGKCIQFGTDWITPTEFESLCGRGNSKDWKRSIRFGGRTLQTLIDQGHLTPHASSCICTNCVDDETAKGPVRPFMPYQRKRKSQTVQHTQNHNVKKVAKVSPSASRDSCPLLHVQTTDESSESGTPASLPFNLEDAWKVVENATEKFGTAFATVKTLVQAMKERTTQEVANLRSQLQSSFETTTFVESPVVSHHPQIFRLLDSSGNGTMSYSVEVLDPDTFIPVQSSSSVSMTKCENCGRDGCLECSGCRSVHYCSAFCQKKDWPTHQAFCQLPPGAAGQVGKPESESESSEFE